MATVPFPEVKDRNVATPSRVRLTKAVGIEDDEVFDVEPVPGTVYDEGTPLNKEFFDALKRYIDASSGAGEIIPIQYGGTGANNVEDARTNLDVYSKGEVDEELDRTAGLIEPHINRKVTDSTQGNGVHGFYIDQDYLMWVDPNGDGSFEPMPSYITGNGNNGELEDIAMRIGSFSNAGAGWNTFKYPSAQIFEDTPFVLAWCEDPSYIVQIKNPDFDGFLYQLLNPIGISVSTGNFYTGASTGTSVAHSLHSLVTDVQSAPSTVNDPLVIHYVAISYWGE